MSKKAIAVVVVLGAAVWAAGSMAGEAPGGAELVQQRCNQCHTLDRVERARKDRAGWETTVDRMISKRTGLLDPAEREIVIEYLASR